MVEPLIPPGIENRSAFGRGSPGFWGVLLLENHTLMDVFFLIFIFVAFLYGTNIIPRGSLDGIIPGLKILFTAYAILVTTRYPKVILEKTFKKYINILHNRGVLAYRQHEEDAKKTMEEGKKMLEDAEQWANDNLPMP